MDAQLPRAFLRRHLGWHRLYAILTRSPLAGLGRLPRRVWQRGRNCQTARSIRRRGLLFWMAGRGGGEGGRILPETQPAAQHRIFAEPGNWGGGAGRALCGAKAERRGRHATAAGRRNLLVGQSKRTLCADTTLTLRPARYSGRGMPTPSFLPAARLPGTGGGIGRHMLSKRCRLGPVRRDTALTAMPCLPARLGRVAAGRRANL